MGVVLHSFKPYTSHRDEDLSLYLSRQAEAQNRRYQEHIQALNEQIRLKDELLASFTRKSQTRTSPQRSNADRLKNDYAVSRREVSE